VTLRTEIGQMMDLLSVPQGRKGPEVLATFSKERMESIYDYKTAFYSFYLPIACAMYIYGYTEPEKFAIAKDISVALGRKFQSQDDYLDCFADPEHLGKIGTDIQDHKCTWLLVNAMKLASPAQMQVILEHLGKDEPASIQKIKELYLELGLDKLFDKFEDESYAEINEKIENAKGQVPSILFSKILKKIHRRSY
jgi:farnesyl diphosphate synthase